MPGDLPTFNCIVAFLISSPVGPAPASCPLGESWPMKTPAQCIGHRRGLEMLWPALKDRFLVCQQGTSTQRAKRGLDLMWGSIDSLRQHTIVSSRQVLYTIILHGPKLSLECIWSSGFASRWLWQECFFLSGSCVYLLCQTSFGVFWSTGQQLQP